MTGSSWGGSGSGLGTGSGEGSEDGSGTGSIVVENYGSTRVGSDVGNGSGSDLIKNKRAKPSSKSLSGSSNGASHEWARSPLYSFLWRLADSQVSTAVTGSLVDYGSSCSGTWGSSYMLHKLSSPSGDPGRRSSAREVILPFPVRCLWRVADFFSNQSPLESTMVDYSDDADSTHESVSSKVPKLINKYSFFSCINQGIYSEFCQVKAHASKSSRVASVVKPIAMWSAPQRWE